MPPTIVYRTDYAPPDFLVESIDLRFELDAEQTHVSSSMRVRRNPAVRPAARFFRLDGCGPHLVRLTVDGCALQDDVYVVDSDGLEIRMGLPDAFEVGIDADVRPRGNTALVGLYETQGVLCTHCEPDGFRRITFFPDRPDVLSRFTVTLVADRDRFPCLLSNGNLDAGGDLPAGRHWARWIDPHPKSSYLFALVAGRFARLADTFVTRSGRSVALHLYADPAEIDRCHFALECVKRAMRWDEQAYGREYDLDVFQIAVVADHNFGAMENKGLNIYNAASIVAERRASTDDDFRLVAVNVPHEYFHNWSGNRVACRDWFQLSLKEGFTTFRHQQYEEDLFGVSLCRINVARTLRTKQFPEDAGATAHPVIPESYVEVGNLYTLTVYDKGAQLIRMLRTLVGPDAFRRATDLFFERYDGHAAVTEDLVDAVATASGRRLDQFRRWYHQAGTPELDISSVFDPGQRTCSLTVRQSCPATPGQAEKEPFHLPLAIGLVAPDGQEIPTRLRRPDGRVEEIAGILEIREPAETFCFVDVGAAPIPSLLRGFSAPVKVNYGYRDDELALLVARDGDAFSRWDAAQEYAFRLVSRMIDARARGQAMQTDAAFVAAMRDLLCDTAVDRALLAELLTLPSEKALSDRFDPIDVEGLEAACLGLKRTFAETARSDLLATYEHLADRRPYRPDAPSMARRALRNLCLDYLVESRDPEALDLCAAQALHGDNLTDVVAALGMLVHVECPQREEALAAFYDRWRDQPLAIDKWFQVQALTRLPDALDRVLALTEHAAFDWSRPLRVKSLLAWFFLLNFARFHDARGAAYSAFADLILKIDAINPTYSAWNLRRSDLCRWRRFDVGRQAKMVAQLQRIVSAPSVSKGLYETAARSLESPTEGTRA
jgi:aminopeptidase N